MLIKSCNWSHFIFESSLVTVLLIVRNKSLALLLVVNVELQKVLLVFPIRFKIELFQMYFVVKGAIHMDFKCFRIIIEVNSYNESCFAL